MNRMSLSYSQGSGTIKEEIGETKEKLADGKECLGMLYSGHNMDKALMNSQNLWLSAPDLHKTKAVNLTASMGEVLMRLYPR